MPSFVNLVYSSLLSNTLSAISFRLLLFIKGQNMMRPIAGEFSESLAEVEFNHLIFRFNLEK